MTPAPDQPESAKRFRVALVFPGERRPFVAAVAEHLAKDLGRAAILYDDWYAGEFAHPDLDTCLQDLYRDQSGLIAVFLCADYERKDWCRLPWRAVRDLIECRRADTVMPLRFDATEVPGLFPSDGYVWIGRRKPQVIARLILERLGLKPPPPPRPPLRWPLMLLPLLLILGGVVARLVDDARHEVTGTILDGTGRPVPEARVAVPELGLDTRTDARGQFTLYIPGREPQQVQLVASAPGLTPHRQTVLPGTHALSVTLRPY